MSELRPRNKFIHIMTETQTTLALHTCLNYFLREMQVQ